MKFSRSDVFEMVDALFHMYASSHRSDAKEELANMIQRREGASQPAVEADAKEPCDMCESSTKQGAKMSHIGCKYLDYSDNYIPACELITIEPEGWKYWKRLYPPYEGAPVNVQFCGQGRGRINGIFGCINPGEMPCFEAQI